MLEERLLLKGDKTERIYQSLRKAGWFPERKVDISSVLEYYKKWNIELNPQAISFFREYYGIASQWYIEVTNLEWAADFDFQLFPYPRNFHVDIVDFMYDDSVYILESDEYKSVKAFSKEYVVMVGEIGYYYPARVWIGNSGTIYCTHDYEDDVRKFDSIIQLILHELFNHDLESVAMKP